MKPIDCIFTSSVKRLDPTGKLQRAFVDDMWHCLLPHAQNGSSRMPQSHRVAAQRPRPVRYRLRRIQSLLLRSKPGWRMVGSIIRNWLGTSCLNQSTTNDNHLQIYLHEMMQLFMYVSECWLLCWVAEWRLKTEETSRNQHMKYNRDIGHWTMDIGQPASYKSLEVWTSEFGTVVYCLYIHSSRSKSNE